MAMEPAGTAISGAPPEMPSIAAEILIVTEPYLVSDGSVDDSNHLMADQKYEGRWLSRRRARRSQRSG